MDPDRSRQRRGPRRFADEAFGKLPESCGPDALPVMENFGGGPRVDQVESQQRCGD